MSIEKYVLINDKPISIDVKNGKIVNINKQQVSPEIAVDDDGEYSVKLNGAVFTGETIKLKQNLCTVLINGNTYNFIIETEKSYKRSKKMTLRVSDCKVSIPAMLPGLVCDVMVEVGQLVVKGETLLTLEAMKMQNEILCPQNGVIKQIRVKPGDNVIKDQILIEVEAIA